MINRLFSILHIYIDHNYKFIIEISPIVYILLVIPIIYIIYKIIRMRKHYRVVKIDINLGKVGKAEIRPNIEDIQIAHKIWTELITRKAALPIDVDHDVIDQIYDSWYILFTKVREFIGNLPAELVREEYSTKEIIRIATETLNNGLRPHLTKWQAKYKNWYSQQENALKKKTPQEVQKLFPKYDLLIADMLDVNQQLIQYAEQLKKIIDGK